MTTPGNPVFGSGVLRIPVLQSPNYVAGVSGWAIFQDGTVEFNSGTFRGTVTAGTFKGTDFEINTSGAFFYSGTPALGNLIASIAATAGTDSHGNVYKEDIAVYGSTSTYVQMLAATRASLSLGTGDAAETAAGLVSTRILGSGTARHLQSLMQSPAVSGSTDFTQLDLSSRSVDLVDETSFSVSAQSTGRQGAMSIDPVTFQLSIFDGTNLSTIDVTPTTVSVGAPVAANITASTNNMTSSLASTRVRAAGQTVSSLAPTFVSLTGLLLPLDIGTWQIRIRVFINANASAGQWQIQITVPAGTSGNYSFKWESAAGVSGLNVNRTSFAVALGGPSPSVAGAYWATIEGIVTLTAAGNINVKGATTIAIDTFDVESGSYFEAFPVL